MASPYPGMGSSVLVDPQVGAFLTTRGYSLSTRGTSWIPIAESENYQTDEAEGKSGSLSLLMTSTSADTNATNTETNTATLSLRFDEILSQLKLEIYAKKWAREYAQFGFEILGSQSIQLKGRETLVIDLIQKVKSQKIRQVLIKQEKKVAIFTCRDHQNQFSKTLPTCNQVIQNFNFL
jgi:galactitol-specific phosphotransferase system IIB component